MMSRNMSHDNMSGFKKISSSEIEVEEFSSEKYLEGVISFAAKCFNFLYSILNEVLLPCFFTLALLCSLYTIIVFDSIESVLTANLSVLILYYADHLQSKPYRR